VLIGKSIANTDPKRRANKQPVCGLSFPIPTAYKPEIKSEISPENLAPYISLVSEINEPVCVLRCAMISIGSLRASASTKKIQRAIRYISAETVFWNVKSTAISMKVAANTRKQHSRAPANCIPIGESRKKYSV